MGNFHISDAIKSLEKASKSSYWDGDSSTSNKEEVRKLISDSLEVYHAYYELFQAIENAKTSTSKNKMVSYIDIAESIIKAIDPDYSLWTECSKGLPPTGMECLIRYYNSSTCENLTDIAWIDSDGEWQFIRENGGYFPYDFKKNISRWMPSPSNDGWPRITF